MSLHSFGKRPIRFSTDVGPGRPVLAWSCSPGGQKVALMIYILVLDILLSPLLMFSSLRWTSASDNELTLSLMISSQFMTSLSHRSPQTLYKSNHSVLGWAGAPAVVWDIQYASRSTASLGRAALGHIPHATATPSQLSSQGGQEQTPEAPPGLQRL